MSDALEITIDDREFQQAMKRLEKQINDIPVSGLKAAGEEIIRIATPRVPIDTGTLRKRGTSQIIGDEVVIGYNIKYAAKLHEHPEYKFREPGTGAKFLENPVKENLPQVLNKVGEVWGKKGLA